MCEILICRTLFLVLSFWALASCSDEPMLEERPETRSAEEGYRVSEYGAKTCASVIRRHMPNGRSRIIFMPWNFPTKRPCGRILMIRSSKIMELRQNFFERAKNSWSRPRIRMERWRFLKLPTLLAGSPCRNIW